MRMSRFAIMSALVLATLLMTASPAFCQLADITVAHWGQSEINEDGNLRFRISTSASGISWTCCPDANYTQLYLQLWAIVMTKAGDMIPVLIKSKDAYDAAGNAAKSIMGTSARFRLAPGTYTYYLFVVLNTGMTPSGTVLAVSQQHPTSGITVTLP